MTLSHPKYQYLKDLLADRNASRATLGEKDFKVWREEQDFMMWKEDGLAELCGEVGDTPLRQQLENAQLQDLSIISRAPSLWSAVPSPDELIVSIFKGATKSPNMENFVRDFVRVPFSAEELDAWSLLVAAMEHDVGEIFALMFDEHLLDISKKDAPNVSKGSSSHGGSVNQAVAGAHIYRKGPPLLSMVENLGSMSTKEFFLRLDQYWRHQPSLARSVQQWVEFKPERLEKLPQFRAYMDKSVIMAEVSPAKSSLPKKM